MLLELIARLNAKTCNLMGAGGGRSNNTLVPEDIAAALASVQHPLGSALLKVKYAGHPPNALYCQWEALVIQEAADKGWKAKKKATFSHLAYAVMGEHMDCRCKACKGRGVKNKNPEPGEVVVPGMGRYIIVDCIACNGTGQGKPNQSLRGRLLGMTPSSYQETWHDRFEHLLLELSMIERNSADDFARKMKKR